MDTKTFTTNLKVLTMLELCRFAVLKLKLTVTDSAPKICHCGTAETFPQLLCHFGGMSYLFSVTWTIRSSQNAAYRKYKHVSLWGVKNKDASFKSLPKTIQRARTNRL